MLIDRRTSIERLRVEILSEQLPHERVAELLTDHAFAFWLSSRQRKDPS